MAEIRKLTKTSFCHMVSALFEKQVKVVVLKNAPTTYKRHIDPWTYDKSLAVRNGVPSSIVYDHSLKRMKPV